MLILGAAQARDPAREPTAQRLVEIQLCDYYQTKPCELPFGPDRRFRVPADLLHPTGFGRTRYPDKEVENGIIRTDWGRLRQAAGQTGAEPTDGGRVQMLISSSPGDGLDPELDNRLQGTLSRHAPEIRAARARGDATVTVEDLFRNSVELAFRRGSLASERRCSVDTDGDLSVCEVAFRWGGVHVKFHYWRRPDLPTAEAIELVVALIDSFVVEGPKLKDMLDRSEAASPTPP